MDNPETLAILAVYTRNSRHRTKTNNTINTTQKTKTMNNTNPIKNRG
jgi:hypothetical protein